MTDSRTAKSREQKAKYNIYTTLLYQIISAICGLVVPKVLLSRYGSEAYGATTSILQFLGYIVLLEGGVGGVARAALYKPLAENDTEKIDRIYFEVKRFFWAIAGIFCVYVLVLACCFKAISHIEIFDWLSTFLLVLVISISTFAQYFIGISNAILLQADQKTYISNIYTSLTLIANAVLVVALVSVGADLITVKLVSSCVYAIKPILLWLYVRKNYCIHKTERQGNLLTDKWTGLGQHMAFFFHSHTDVIVLTLFADLKYVAVYSVYNMITSLIQKLSASFSSGLESVLGNMYVREEKQLLGHTFDLYETMVSFFSSVLLSVTAIMIAPFVKIYTSGISDANYDMPVFGVLMALAAYLSCLSAPYSSVVIAAGHFRQTRWAAYGEAVINVSLSILLVKKFGLVGIAVGTVVAVLYKQVFYVVYLKRNIMERRVGVFIKRVIVNSMTVIIIFLLGKYALTFFQITSYGRWALAAAVVTLIAGLITLSANLIFYRKNCVELIKKSVRRS